MRRIAPKRFLSDLDVRQITQIYDCDLGGLLTKMRLPTMETVHKRATTSDGDRRKPVERSPITLDRRVVLAKSRVQLFDQVRLLMNVAAAQEVFAKRQQLGEQVIAQAYALKTRALAKLGELVRDLLKNKGAQAGGKKAGPRGAYVESRDTTPTLADLGISKKVSHVAQQLGCAWSAGARRAWEL